MAVCVCVCVCVSVCVAWICWVSQCDLALRQGLEREGSKSARHLIMNPFNYFTMLRKRYSTTGTPPCTKAPCNGHIPSVTTLWSKSSVPNAASLRRTNVNSESSSIIIHVVIFV